MKNPITEIKPNSLAALLENVLLQCHQVVWQFSYIRVGCHVTKEDPEGVGHRKDLHPPLLVPVPVTVDLGSVEGWYGCCQYLNIVPD